MCPARFDFRGKVVLVTGVGRAGQIGNAVALAFGKAGAKIVACDLNAVGVATGCGSSPRRAWTPGPVPAT